MDVIPLLSLVFTAIGTIVAIAQWDKVWALAEIRFSALPSRRSNLDPSLTAISSLLARLATGKKAMNYEVRGVRTLAELNDLWHIDAVAYGEANLDYSVFQSWWLAYPKGLYAVFVNGEVIGALGIWPVSKKWIEEFGGGLATESSLPTDLLQTAGVKGTDHWYVSGIVIKQEWKKSAAVPILLKEATLGWAIDSKLKHPVHVYAMAISDAGEKLLARYGFELKTPANKMKDGYSLYTKSVGRSEIIQLIRMHDTHRRAI